MVISDEIKFPRPPRLDSTPAPLLIREIDGLSPVLPINHYTKKWRKGAHRPTIERVDDSLSDAAERALQELITQVNENLGKANVPIHIGLVREEEGYALDIYDCGSGVVCTIVREESIHINDLPAMLRNLQQEAGLLIDLIV